MQDRFVVGIPSTIAAKAELGIVDGVESGTRHGSALLAIEKDGHGAVIDQFDMHVSSELSRGNR